MDDGGSSRTCSSSTCSSCLLDERGTCGVSRGAFVRAVHQSGLMRGKDGKALVDLPLKVSKKTAECRFRALEGGADELQGLIEECCGMLGGDMEPVVTGDWADDPPSFLPGITSGEWRNFSLVVHKLWLSLLRRCKRDVREHPERFSLLPLPHPIVVPGERFRESYYWDSYWHVRGLLVSQMATSAKGIVENFVEMVDRYGFVPNGARSYYLNRTQPPLLSRMVVAIVENHTPPETDFIRRSLNALILEHEYLTSGKRCVRINDRNGRAHAVSRYYADWDRPRWESFAEDLSLAAGLCPESAAQLWRDIASACASGWDFSTRWMLDYKNLTSTCTTHILPPDLNAFILRMELDISLLAQRLGDEETTERFSHAAERRRQMMDALFWDNDEGCWRDILISPDILDPDDIDRVVALGENATWREGVYVSNYIPLWCGVLIDADPRSLMVLSSFQSSGLLHDGLVSASTRMVESSQQWDYPNVWAPLQHMVIEAFQTSCGEEGKACAREMAHAWIRVCHDGWVTSGFMFEKYCCERRGHAGGGGEYGTQKGFGWTNAVCLLLLDQFGLPPPQDSVEARP